VEYIHNRSSRRILAMVAASWGVSALISLPPLFGGRNPNSDPDITGICLISQDWAYTVFSTLGAFYLPMVVMSVIYARVYRTARHRIRKTTFRRPLQGDASVDRGNARLLGPCDVDQSTPQTLLQGGTPFYRQVTQSTTDTQPELTPPVEVQLPPAKVEATAAGNVEDWIGLSSVLRPRQHSVGYMGDGGNVEEELKNDVDDVDDAERESGEKFSTTVAVGNACTIILAAASTAPPAADIVNIDEDLNTETPEPHQSPMSIMSPFFARFLDGNWLAAARYGRRAGPPCSDDDDGGGGLNGAKRSAAMLQTNMAAARRRAREKQELKRERKAARTLAIVTGTFLVCWLPFFIVALLRPFCTETCYFSSLLVSVINWLGYFNSLLNPIIYTVFNPDFRSAFRKILFGKYRDRSALSRMHALRHLPFVPRE